jgi:hypothetical protein
MLDVKGVLYFISTLVAHRDVFRKKKQDYLQLFSLAFLHRLVLKILNIM